jgi:4-hydroxy-tetrahydrodipicolinate synthase
MEMPAGILPVIPTPFREGRFDENSFTALLDYMLPWVDGYTLLGSTGESPSLTVSEREEIAAFALSATPSDKTVVVGVSSTSARDATRLAQHAEAHGAGAVLCSAPYYFPNTPDGVLRFLREVDQALGIDLILYDNPAATKTTLHAADVSRWADELQNLHAVKLTDHDLAKVPVWQMAGLQVIGGDDPILFQYLAAGVTGVMMIAPAVLPESFRCVWESIQAGDVDHAHFIFASEVLPFVHAFGIGNEIATTKALLADLGVFASPELRAPLTDVDDERRQLVRRAFDIGLEAARTREGPASPRQVAGDPTAGPDPRFPRIAGDRAESGHGR